MSNWGDDDEDNGKSDWIPSPPRCEHGNRGSCSDCNTQKEAKEREERHEYFLKENSLKECSGCGKQMSKFSTNTFCDDCGNRVKEDESEKKRCPSCGRTGHNSYCPKCGDEME